MIAVSSLMDHLLDLSKNSIQYGNSMCPSMIRKLKVIVYVRKVFLLSKFKYFCFVMILDMFLGTSLWFIRIVCVVLNGTSSHVNLLISFFFHQIKYRGSSRCQGVHVHSVRCWILLGSRYMHVDDRLNCNCAMKNSNLHLGGTYTHSFQLYL